MTSRDNTAEAFQIFAIKYASVERSAAENFIGGDAHCGSMPLDYFVWVVTNRMFTFLVDTGFDEEAALIRGRSITRSVRAGLQRIGLLAEDISDVIITHMHYDHCGNAELCPNATFHLQDEEMAYCTGRGMGHRVLRQPYNVEDVKTMVDRIYRDRVRFHRHTSELAPGVSVHRIGGHTTGIQVVRVMTERGWVVLARQACLKNLDSGNGRSRRLR